jgi:hypothetical protein
MPRPIFVQPGLSAHVACVPRLRLSFLRMFLRCHFEKRVTPPPFAFRQPLRRFSQFCVFLVFCRLSSLVPPEAVVCFGHIVKHVGLFSSKRRMVCSLLASHNVLPVGSAISAIHQSKASAKKTAQPHAWSAGDMRRSCRSDSCAAVPRMRTPHHSSMWIVPPGT